MSFSEELRILFERQLKNFIKNEYHGPNILDQSVSYALNGEGKRVRPLFCLLCCQALQGKSLDAMRAAIAVEMIHTYSLVHDDLPCMDNDHLRRGKPTCHIKFGEDHALLAGDALLTDAFAILSDKEFFPELALNYSPVNLGRLVRELASASGSKGMVMGQELDLFWTRKNNSSIEDLHQIHIKKTGMLIGAACAMGGICGDASDEVVDSLRSFGVLIGHAFQILDDLIDEYEGIGKSVGKDREMGKLTYLSHMSPEVARKAAQTYTDQAAELIHSLENFDATALESFALGLLSRGC